MAKMNWKKVYQQNIINKKGYEEISNEIPRNKQCTEKQYQLINKLIEQSNKNLKFAKKYMFLDFKTNKLLPRNTLSKKFVSMLIDSMLNNK